MLSSNSIQESSFISTKSKQIQTILPYGKHDPNQMETAQKAQEDVSKNIIHVANQNLISIKDLIGTIPLSCLKSR